MGKPVCSPEIRVADFTMDSWILMRLVADVDEQGGEMKEAVKSRKSPSYEAASREQRALRPGGTHEDGSQRVPPFLWVRLRINSRKLGLNCVGGDE